MRKALREAGALEVCLHKNIHKDLKPDNILLLYEGTRHITPVIADVGTSKVYILRARTNYKDSTYEYLAPEQHNMQPSTLRSDIW
ncbi:kinase-like domain-containing protein [Schizothecium vesticola]|uniref:Kinase-like domain-containing protein n=1 Tax=Schizothecium vesticola TaxID=314040 RepID=A0AA40KBR8_9PEZI|nr:kinase-like domain-containing protein [Schizothecium vesticola]